MTVAEQIRSNTKALSWDRFAWAEYYYLTSSYIEYSSIIIAKYLFIDGSTLITRLYTEVEDEAVIN